VDHVITPLLTGLEVTCLFRSIQEMLHLSTNALTDLCCRNLDILRSSLVARSVDYLDPRCCATCLRLDGHTACFSITTSDKCVWV
jgi:hypothetical protein